MSLCQTGAALDHLASQGGVAGRHAIYQQRVNLLRPGYEQLGLRIARWENMPCNRSARRSTSPRARPTT